MKNDDFIEVRPHVFLSKKDPQFYKKYLTFFPNDRQVLYEYGVEQMKKGELESGLKLLEKAASFGHGQAKRQLVTIEKSVQKQLIPPSTQVVKEANYLPGFLLFMLFLLLTVLLFLFLWHFWFKENRHITETDHRTTYERTLYEDKKSVSSISPARTHTTKETLPAIVLQSAAEGYKKTHGSFPKNESSLIQAYPNNTLSFIPKGTNYQQINKGYVVDSDQKSGELFEQSTLSLHFYPSSHELALQRGSEVLAVYPVASGKSELPPSKSQVTLRVVEPKGKNGAFGSRGLALTENFAIHGTNDPSSIGQNVSEGCLRMQNEDIENLFPYVPIGTPFVVEEVSKKPNAPTFTDGLPTISPKNDSSPSETSPKSFAWKQ